MLVGDIVTMILGEDGGSGKLRDPRFTEGAVRKLIMGALRAVAKDVLLPDLESEAILYTTLGAEFAALPSDFHRNLYQISSALRSDIPVLYSKLALQRLHPNSGVGSGSTGNVSACAVVGDNLFYRPVPVTAEALSLCYFKKPGAVRSGVEVLVQDLTNEDEITCIPAEFLGEGDEDGDNLICAYVLWKALNDVEDASDGKPNAMAAKAEFEEGKRALKRWIARRQGNVSARSERVFRRSFY